ncbi:GGDEF domain-containing protein [Aliikangiella marina]|uniref:diguanylate cyclase n=1 Tax=Aliikangiella marina TaxID=1712262 RepID=A0A545T529_9GAMM|nr:GGDEF domain-containing protein [Aliikangiella marina]TQV72319.1 GGDEF domain-containing protein [Aliikangiella marina]
MIRKLEKLLRKMLDIFLIQPPANNANTDSIRLFFSVSFLSVFGFVIISIFAYVSFVNQADSRGYFLAMLSVANIGNYFLLRTTKNIWAAATIAAILILIVFFYLFLTGGLNQTGLFWCFAIAPLFFFFLGHRWGLLITLVLSTISLLILNVDDFILLQADYPETVKTRFPIIFAVVCFLLFIQELSRYRVDEHNKLLTEKLEVVARTDELSGLMNRRGAEEALYREYLRGIRSKRYASVAIIDIDHFKKVNDQYGHAAGDNSIRMVAKCLTNTVRHNDYVARWGGEEFLVILTEIIDISSERVYERIRQAVADIRLSQGNQQFSITVSIGIARFRDREGVASVMREADKALYRAKENGRNRIEIAE